VNYHNKASSGSSSSSSSSSSGMCSTSFTIGLQMANPVDFEELSASSPASTKVNSNDYDDDNEEDNQQQKRKGISARFVRVPYDFDVVAMARAQEEKEQKEKQSEEDKMNRRRQDQHDREARLIAKMKKLQKGDTIDHDTAAIVNTVSVSGDAAHHTTTPSSKTRTVISIQSPSTAGGDITPAVTTATASPGSASPQMEYSLSNTTTAAVRRKSNTSNSAAAAFGLNGFRWPRESSAIKTLYQYRPGISASSSSASGSGATSQGNRYLREVTCDRILPHDAL